MDAKTAQAYINSLKGFKSVDMGELLRLKHLKVNYDKVSDFPQYKKKKIDFIVDYIVNNYNPNEIYLVKSQLDGYPIDEKTSIDDFNNIQEVLGKSKFSDWDLLVDTLDCFQKIEQIAPLIKIDMFKYHHRGVRKLKIYGRRSM